MGCLGYWLVGKLEGTGGEGRGRGVLVSLGSLTAPPQPIRVPPGPVLQGLKHTSSPTMG